MKKASNILLLIGGIFFALEGVLKFKHVQFFGMDMPCGASLVIVGLGLVLWAISNMKSN